MSWLVGHGGVAGIVGSARCSPLRTSLRPVPARMRGGRGLKVGPARQHGYGGHACSNRPSAPVHASRKRGPNRRRRRCGGVRWRCAYARQWCCALRYMPKPKIRRRRLARLRRRQEILIYDGYEKRCLLRPAFCPCKTWFEACKARGR